MRLFIVFAPLFAVSAPLNCYICNSKKQPDCIDNYQAFNTICPVRSLGGVKLHEPVGCRVTRQYSKEKMWIIRECGYLGEERERKFNTTTYLNGEPATCVFSQCSENLCNSAESSNYFLTAAAVFVAIFKLFA
ncbi:Protein sleepless [Caenorhabditis elegans]|uniref:Protein sleepless n=1 Tax=Caenorhabditis elegans TaxID=6239 RepID=P91371_CAEEL|nr:Protein sleepless [Caenorhabditis elegans]CCD70975.1 Protein sleepless [Caenorhabditis elegans]|eukprot:NP_499967.2 Uncharacterized protein CELE_K11H12.6 [Caenorhabditis elegans]